MLTLFKTFIQQHHLFTLDQVMLLAVSGGRDSVALLHLMNLAGYRFVIAHCNFHIRPNDCDRDQQFVEHLAQQYHCPIHVAQFNTLEDASRLHRSVEEVARDQRYTFFYQLCKEYGYSRIVTGHHKDDSIETFFINLLRGTGISGLHGILPLNGIVARPLLPFSREDINQFVEANHLPFVDDYTNDQDLYKRNQIRHQLIPLLRQLSPNFDSSMTLTMDNLLQTEITYQSYIQELKDRYVTAQSNNHQKITRSSNLTATILYEILKEFGFNYSQAKNCLTAQTGSHFLSSSHKLTVERDCFELQSQTSDLENKVPEINVIPFLITENPLQVLLHPQDGAVVQKDFILLDADKVKLPLHIRHWQVGDRFRPFGMKGSQLLSDYFSTHKFSEQQKTQQWILTDAQDQILWIVGFRASSLYSVSLSTQKVLKVSISL